MKKKKSFLVRIKPKTNAFYFVTECIHMGMTDNSWAEGAKVWECSVSRWLKKVIKMKPNQKTQKARVTIEIL